MIKKLKIKFIFLAMSALLVLLAIIITGMNLINYNLVVEECDGILSVLSKNRGVFPDMNEKPDKFQHNMSPETPYESRYFWVVVDEKGNVLDTNTSKIASVDETMAEEYAQKAISIGAMNGFIGDFRYIIYEETNGIRISFLDCGRRLNAFKDFLYTSIFMSVCGLIIVFFVISVLSGKIIKPIAESYEKQKRFITDAGHEIKTPLTIINANVDILEMELGEENESLADIQYQTKRLRSLTDDLVMLSRMEENENSMQKIEFPISDVVAETVHSFIPILKGQNKEYIYNIQPMLSYCGNDKAIIQLVSLLLDNAVKYSNVGGTVSFNLWRKGKNICISVYNTTSTNITQEQLKYVFERFYRTDSSRNSEIGGHGIGLSVAKAIVNAHGGEITASTKDGQSFEIYITLPM